MKTIAFLLALGCGLAAIVLLGWPGQAQEPPGPETQPLTSTELARFRELDGRPVQGLTNVDLSDYLPLRERVSKDDPQRLSAAEEIGRLAVRSLGQKYRLRAVQFDSADGDCVTLVLKTVALSLAKDWPSYYVLTERLRHKDGVVDYKNRNFFTLGDLVPSNSWLLADVTGELGPASRRPAQSFTHAVFPKVFVDRPAAPGSKYIRTVFKGYDMSSPDKEVRTDLYMPRAEVQGILPDLRSGDVVLVLRPAKEGRLKCDHLGLIVRDPAGVVAMVHSAPPRVRQEPLTGLLDRCRWVVGLKFLRLKDNARELAEQEVQRLVSSIVVPPPDKEDKRIDALRARRQSSTTKPSG